MRSMKVVAVISLLAAGMAFGASAVTYTVETGGNNHAYDYEAKATVMPFFTSGVTDGSTTVEVGQDLTWAVRVTVSGDQAAGPGVGQPVLGAANLVFDLQLFMADGVTPVAGFGAAPLACSTGTPGGAGAKACKPSDKGFWSTINDGDSDDPNNGAYRLDPLANAAFAWGIYNTGTYPAAPGTQLYRLIDTDAAGPRFDYGWYPTSSGRGGVDTDGSKPINTTVTTTDGTLVGFGAGYKSYDALNHMVGVGIDTIGLFDSGYGIDRPLFEGQINTTGLAVGTYVLKVVPSADGNNVVHGDVQWADTTPNYGGAGSFAAKADGVVGSQVTFQVTPGAVQAAVLARKLFYNASYYDSNNAAIQTPGAGARDDDADAIDPTKEPLKVGDGMAQFKNWTGYDKGITGLIYDVRWTTRAPIASDFTFTSKGKAGTSTAAVAYVAFAAQATAEANVTRCVFTFTNVKNTWLEVAIGTGFGLVAGETHWWGNAVGDSTGNTAPNITVSPSDEAACRPPNVRTAFNRATVDFPYDYNKDSIVGPSDEAICRPPNQTNAFSAVKMIVR